MTYNPRQKALEATYFQGEYVYNYGGWVPSNIDQTPNPTPSFTPTNTPTPTQTNTPTRTTTPTPTPTPSSTPEIPISDLLYRFDASNSANLDLRSSGGIDYVEKWRDGSPNGNDVSQSDTTKQPIYQSDGFGSYEVLFDGSNDFLRNGGITNIPSGITAYTAFYVMRIDDYVPDFTGVATNADNDLFYLTSNDRLFGLYYPGSYFDNITTWSLQPNFLLWTRKGTSSGSMVGRLNDVSETGDLFDSWAPDPAITSIALGANDTGIGGFFEGSLREVIMYKRLLSDVETDDVVAYLKTKWNYAAW